MDCFHETSLQYIHCNGGLARKTLRIPPRFLQSPVKDGGAVMGDGPGFPNQWFRSVVRRSSDIRCDIELEETGTPNVLEF